MRKPKTVRKKPEQILREAGYERPYSFPELLEDLARVASIWEATLAKNVKRLPGASQGAVGGEGRYGRRTCLPLSFAVVENMRGSLLTLLALAFLPAALGADAKKFRQIDVDQFVVYQREAKNTPKLYSKIASVCVAAGFEYFEVREHEVHGGSVSARVKFYPEKGEDEDDRISCSFHADDKRVRVARGELFTLSREERVAERVAAKAEQAALAKAAIEKAKAKVKQKKRERREAKRAAKTSGQRDEP